MQRKPQIALIAGITAVTLGGIGAAVAGAATGGGSDTPITGTDLQRASEAALNHLGQGRVTGTEVGDEDSHYEVEVTLDDGSQVDVQLDETFAVVKTMTDSDNSGDNAQD